MSQRSYAIIGTGAIGGYYGACLQRAEFEVRYLLRSDYDQVARYGLAIESCQGNFSLPEVEAYNDPQKMPPSDIAIVALKATQNHQLPYILPHVLKEDGIVLLLQNGIDYEPEIARSLSATQTLIGGICFICSNKVAPGVIRHLDYGAIAMATYYPNYRPAGITEDMRCIAADFEAAGIEIRLREDLLQTRWEKLVWNIPYNGLSVVLNATTEEMMAAPEIRSLIEAIMAEVALAATASDRHISRSYIQSRLKHTEKMQPYLTSMKLDYDAKRPLEIEAIIGKPLTLASRKELKLPRIQTLYQQLQFLDRQNLNSARR